MTFMKNMLASRTNSRTQRLLILGAGHVAREVAYYARPLDFQVTVLDDRVAMLVRNSFLGLMSYL